MISLVYSSISRRTVGSCESGVYQIRKVAIFLLFRRNCAVHQVLKVGTSSAQSALSFYFRDVTHKHLDMFFIGPVVEAQQIV